MVNAVVDHLQQTRFITIARKLMKIKKAELYGLKVLQNVL